MYRNILLAYDGSPAGDEALNQVIAIASADRTVIHLLVVIEPADSVLPIEGMYFARQTATSDADTVLEHGLQSLRLHGLSGHTLVRQGHPAEQIAQCAREVGADLVVVGHRKQNAIVRWLNGSVSAAMLNRAPCSVLVAMGRELAD